MTVAVNAAEPPRNSEAVVGEIDTRPGVRGPVIVSVAFAVAVLSADAAAVSMNVPGAGTNAGAVYIPSEIWPNG